MKGLRSRFERFCYQNRHKGIPNLMLYISVATAIVYLMCMFDGSDILYRILCFDRNAILRGQVWRLFTYVFTYGAGSNNLLLVAISLFCYYSLGRAIENIWGTFRFNLFYITGVVLMDIYAMIFNTWADVYYLNLSLFLGYATLYPNTHFLLFFIFLCFFFIKSERKTYQDYLKSSHNSQMESEAFKRFGIQILIPFEMTNNNYGENFMWISNGGVKARQDLVIYSYPYTDVKNLELNNLIHKRDSILKANIPGPDEGSYMGTELVYHTPSLNEIAINNAYCAEVHGLWKVMNGGLMGGPFVSHTRIDEINNRVITIEGFVFAPERDKRNYIRQLEAILYTVRMPQEVNEVIVQKKK